MRGEQFGAALGARVTSEPRSQDLDWADVIVLVKRAIGTHGARAAASGKPVVWDAIDFWRQPAENHLTEQEAVALLEQTRERVRPVLTIGATEAMAAACGGVCLPHHGRIGLAPTPAREHCRVVGYDGNAVYLEAWWPALKAICARRGWVFLVNPPDLSAVDILVALRGGMWDGWICREWKSGVKIANAVLAGRPILTQDCAAARELKPDGSIVGTVADLDAAFDHWADYERRRAVATRSLDRARDFTLQAASHHYTGILDRLIAYRKSGTGLA